MAQREFTDSHGTHWLIWSTTPTTTSVPGAMREGWLTFESEGERRRLVPVPRDWEKAADERLGLYCRAAEGVTRKTPIRGIVQAPEKET